MGCYLRKKTEGRRAHITEVMETDQKAYRRRNSEGKGAEDKRRGYISDSAAAWDGKDEERASKEWDGIVGFFHPFW